MKYNIKVTVTILFGILIFSIFFFNKFYGFEYEDSFINPTIALSNNYFDKIENFRTSEYTKIINNIGYDKKLYPGHYMPYSFYLHSIQYFFNTKEFLIHKIGNCVLLMLSIVTILFHRKKTIDLKIIFILALFCSLPFIYIINSALIENISFFVGILLVTWIRYYVLKEKSFNYKAIAILLILVISIIKRENLIYILLIPFFLDIKDISNKKITLSILLFFIIQLFINPFFTEGIESNSLNKPTFDVEYMLFQLPVYLKSLVSKEGFLLIILSMFFIKFNKKSIYLLLIWFCFILFYSIHYRSKYAIESKEISIFETYRYLVNTLPVLYGVFIFSRIKNLKKYQIPLQLTFVFVSLIILLNSINIFSEFVNDENENYHRINEKLIELNKKEKIRVYDNFILISILNFNKQNIDLLELNETSTIDKSKNTYIINRFNDYDMRNFKNIILIRELSNKKTSVYKVI
jgi:hypothetical protein